MGFSETTLPPIVTAMVSHFLIKPFTVHQISGQNQTFPLLPQSKTVWINPSSHLLLKIHPQKQLRILVLAFLAATNKTENKLISQSVSFNLDYSSFSFGDSCPFQFLVCTVNK